MTYTERFPVGTQEPQQQVDTIPSAPHGSTDVNVDIKQVTLNTDLISYQHSVDIADGINQGASKQFRAGNGVQGVTPVANYGVHEIFQSIDLPSNQALTAVKLDDSTNWRERWITIDAFIARGNLGDVTGHFAGQANDGAFQTYRLYGGAVPTAEGEFNNVSGAVVGNDKGWFYSKAGVASNALPTINAARFTLDSSSDELWIAVSNGTGSIAAGNLFVIYKTDSATQSSAQINAFIKGSITQV